MDIFYYVGSDSSLFGVLMPLATLHFILHTIFHLFLHSQIFQFTEDSSFKSMDTFKIFISFYLNLNVYRELLSL